MCRHLAYLGPPIPLSSLLYEPPHSLAHQAWAPRDMRDSGTINVDGFGVGWFPDRSGPPLRHRRDRPLWTDADLLGLAERTAAGAALAAVRSATPGMASGESACAPFAGDGWLFSHNGRVAGWPGSMVKLAEQLPVADLLTLDAPVDSALLWALVRHRLRAGASPAAAVATTVCQVGAAAPGSRLNLLLVAADQVVATAAGHSLWVRRDDASVLVASEPLDDDPGWWSVPEDALLVADRSRLGVQALTEAEAVA